MARKKKHHEQHHEEHADETWLVPYSDILTLLLALFIVLFASSSLDKKKASEIEYAFSAAFNTLPAEFTSGTLVKFLDDAQELDLGENVGLGTDAHGAVLSIGSLTLFDQRSAELRPDALPILANLSRLMRSNKYKRYRIIVEGHTDDVEVNTPQFPSNWELSSARAAAVVRQLIADGVDDTRLQAVGMANIAPAYPNIDAYGQPIPENREKNRRVVILIRPWLY